MKWYQNRRDFMKQAGLSCLSIAALGKRSAAEEETSAPSKRPNVILIMSDDQGYGDFGVMGNPLIQTPNIDAMAKRGASLSNFYVSPVCSPTRACLMTGRYNYRTRCIDTYIGRSMMDTEETTVAELMRDAGYATGVFGKWHLGDHYPMRPMEQGFETSLVLRGGGIGQPSDPPGGEGKYTDPILYENGREVHAKGYCTDVYFDRAIQWMDKCTKEERNFFAYIPTNAPHGPFDDVPQKNLDYYKTKKLANDRFPQKRGHKLPEKCNEDKRARVFSMISNIDENMGKLFKKLDDMEITENTLIFFLVDNGPNGRRYVKGMRGMKSEVYEGGVRSPLWVQWPAVLKEGFSTDRIAAHIDILPTILDACGVNKPDSLKLDGRSFLPLLKGAKVKSDDRTIVIQSHRGDKPVLYHNFAARSQQWKLLHASGFGKETFEGEPKFELYDMVNDPLEMKDLAKEKPEIVEMMRKRYEAWFNDVGSTRPNNYDPPRIYISTPNENPVVLTRQDWRHIKGRPWAADSNGFWKLYAQEEGVFDVRLRFPSNKEKWTATLEMGDRKIAREIPANASECIFHSVSVKKGNLRLLATLSKGNDTKGPWQIDVIKK